MSLSVAAMEKTRRQEAPAVDTDATRWSPHPQAINLFQNASLADSIALIDAGNFAF